MSVIDQFERELAQRMRELQPLVAEFRELEHVAERLGLRVDEDRHADGREQRSRRVAGQSRRAAKRSRAARASSNGAPIATESAAARKPASKGRSRRAAPASKQPPGARRNGNRREDVLRLVQQRPGISVREIGTELGVDPTGLYRPVSTLQQQGAITKRGTHLNPA